MSSAATESLCSTKTVLLAEDSEMICSLIVDILKAEGYKVIPAADGRKAHDYFREHSDEIDLIVTDIVMPNMNGRELGQQCRDRTLHIGILYMSGCADGQLDPERDLTGNADFIAKPFRPVEFVTKVRSLLDSAKVA